MILTDDLLSTIRIYDESFTPLTILSPIGFLLNSRSATQSRAPAYYRLTTIYF
jgi:hypothetical protein